MIPFLKKALEKKVGFQLNTVSAYRKLEKILYAAGIQVSYSTLNRMFSDETKSINPRLETLNLLSRFLGFISFEELENQHLSTSKRDELYLANEFAIKSLLLNDEFRTAIDIYLDIMDEFREYHPEITQVIGNSFFRDTEFKANDLEYLLSRERIAPYFLEHYVREDDLNGFYAWSIQNMEFRSEFDEEKVIFKNLYLKRKDYLKGNYSDLEKLDYQHLNFHLQSRYFELELMEQHFKKAADLTDFVRERTETILDIVKTKEKDHDKLVLMGRWCRALLYTKSYVCLKDHQSWKDNCYRAFCCNYENLEYKAPIYTFLKLNFNFSLPLDFYWKNRWETSKIESELILSIGFQNDRAINSYKKVLKINYPI